MSFNINNLPQCLDNMVVFLFVVNGNYVKAFDQVLNRVTYSRSGIGPAPFFSKKDILSHQCHISHTDRNSSNTCSSNFLSLNLVGHIDF